MASWGTVEDLPEKAKELLTFWYGQDFISLPWNGWPSSEQNKIWFMGGPEVDAMIVERFGADLVALKRGDYDSWRDHPNPLATVAGVLLGDQLSRNAYRGTAAMYDLDPKSLSWAQSLWQSGAGYKLPPFVSGFMLLPFEHSESVDVLNDGLAIWDKLLAQYVAKYGDHPKGEDKVLDMMRNFKSYYDGHRDVIVKWGRYPHRNALLGRPSTPEEVKGLADKTIPSW